MFSTPRRRAFVLFCMGALTFATIAVSLVTLGRIRDCTSPDGACFQAQRERRLESVRLIDSYTVAAAWCSIATVRAAEQPPQFADLRGCIQRRLAADAITSLFP